MSFPVNVTSPSGEHWALRQWNYSDTAPNGPSVSISQADAGMRAQGTQEGEASDGATAQVHKW